MRQVSRSLLGRVLGAFLVLLAVLGPARAVFAAGTVIISNTQPTENDGKWKLQMTINFGGVPPMPHVPMLFSFTPTALYERDLTDKSPEKPVMVRIPLVNQQGNNESMDVGFSDASGRVFPTTKFDFTVRRERGFEAGEYDLKITREGDGVQVGQIIHLTFKGDNPVVDRRAIVFSGEKPKKVKDDRPAADSSDAKKDAPAAGGDEKKDEPAADGDEKKDVPAPPPVPPKQGGCGCRVGPEGEVPVGALAAIALAGAFVARTRRQRRS
jgi:MYXO-CTERM domain-containing protein